MSLLEDSPVEMRLAEVCPLQMRSFDTLRQECQRFLDPPAGATAGLSPHRRSPAVPRRFGSRVPHGTPRPTPLTRISRPASIRPGQRHATRQNIYDGVLIAVATEGDSEIEHMADHAIFLPEADPLINPILATVPLQLFSYYVASFRGCDVDKPRNLAKSVTVE